ncbi:MAG: hypothetical protein GY754_25855 [bacterium]|nr:hypothetical protein [bacterium]
MLNLTLTDEQVLSLVEQLSSKKKKELLDHLRFEEWLNSPEGLKLKAEREKEVADGRTFSVDDIRDRLKSR